MTIDTQPIRLQDVDDTQKDYNPLYRDPNAIGMLALFSLYIPLAIEPVIGANVGVNYHLAHNHTEGLLVLVGTYTNQNENDAITVFCDNVEVATTLVPADHNNKDISLRIPAKKLSSGIKKMHYSIKRVSENEAEKAPDLGVLIKFEAPGGIDPRPDVPAHQLLKPPILPEEIIQDGVITRPWVQSGFLVTIPHYQVMAEGDKIRLSCHGVIIEQRVEKDQVGQDVEIQVTREHLIKAGDTPEAIFVYEVIDQVHNRSSDWSELTIVALETGGLRLPPPFLKGVEDGKLHIDDLQRKSAIIQIVARGAGFVRGYRVVATLGWPSSSGDTVVYVEEKVITTLGILEFDVPYKTMLKIPSGPTFASYEVIQPNGTTTRSSRFMFLLVGETTLLPAPVLSDADRGSLASTLAQTTVRCGPFEPMTIGDLVRVTWLGTLANGGSYLYQTQRRISQALLNKIIPFVIDGPKHVAPLNRGSVIVLYQSISASNEVRDSYQERYYIGLPKAVLPPPIVEAAVEGVLLPENVSDGVDALVKKIPRLKDGDTLHFKLIGITEQSSFYDALPIDESFVEEDVFYFWLELALLEANDGEEVTLYYWVTHRGEFARASETLTLLIGKVEPPIITSLSDSRGGLVPNGGTSFDKDLTLKGTARAKRNVELLHDSIPISTVPVGDQGNWEFKMLNLAEATYNARVKAVYGNKPESGQWSFTVAKLELPKPSVDGTSGSNLDSEEVPDTGAIIRVPAYTGRSIGDTVRASLTGTGASHQTDSIKVIDNHSLSFVVPRSVVTANSGRPVTVTYFVKSAFAGPEIPSQPLNLNVLQDTWRDSTTDFTSGAGGWGFGPAAFQAQITAGVFQNLTYAHSGHSGVLLSQTFQLKAARTYRFTYSARNISPQPSNVPPIFSVSTSSGVTILAPFSVPRNGVWYSQQANFRVPVSGSYAIRIISHQDRGGGSNADGGNDYQLDSIYVQRL